MKSKKSLRNKSEEKIAQRQFDVFLSYNSADKAHVMAIGEQLKDYGIAPWFDEWSLRSGFSWRSSLEEDIANIKSAAICIGPSDIGSRQREEIEIFLDEAAEREKFPLILVFLPGAPDKPKIFSRFLRSRTWVDFRMTGADPIKRLVYGITGQPIRENRSHILITLLGASPIAVSAMYDLLTEKEERVIDKVIVLRPASESAFFAYELLEEAVAGICELQCEALAFEDVDSWTNTCLFLKNLHNLLSTCQANGDTVFLSLAGAGESAAAIMASIASSFSCVKHLYHLIDHDGKLFLSIYELAFMTSGQKREAMFPVSEKLILVDIPFESGQQINQQMINRLLVATEDELTRMEYDQELMLDPPIILPGTLLDSVLIVPLGKTLMTVTQFYTLLRSQENRNIHQVVLVYPAQATEIAMEAELIREALRQEAKVPCFFDHISGLEEIISSDACRRYQAELETIIDQARHFYPDHRIDLAFSQVEENLVAMTIFAAQKKKLPYVYRSLITDEELGRRIHEGTTVNALQTLDKQGKKEECQERLFLRVYEEEGVYTKINLFKIPLFST